MGKRRNIHIKLKNYYSGFYLIELFAILLVKNFIVLSLIFKKTFKNEGQHLNTLLNKFNLTNILSMAH